MEMESSILGKTPTTLSLEALLLEGVQVTRTYRRRGSGHVIQHLTLSYVKYMLSAKCVVLPILTKSEENHDNVLGDTSSMTRF